MEWQPIETAPRDGTFIDVWSRNHRTCDVFWSDIENTWCIEGYHPEEPTPLARYPAPSHWMPIPEAPKGESRG